MGATRVPELVYHNRKTQKLFISWSSEVLRWGCVRGMCVVLLESIRLFLPVEGAELAGNY